MDESLIIQNCQLETGDYSRQQLIEAIESMTQTDLNTFCKTVMALRYQYSITRGAWATFDKSVITDISKAFELKDVLSGDFELPFDKQI